MKHALLDYEVQRPPQMLGARRSARFRSFVLRVIGCCRLNLVRYLTDLYFMIQLNRSD